ncbi:hypothetical protein ISN45_Aa08g006770 [Arabidopsis thaliana x Arabidopsis arenosa]|uniref:Uncharacterized protein n=1 Tax=Arabidopsis thaliana x Arabidopsis arenosa TaxID=1240361 RepID=A0A8T1XES0_9BRAS|nr:hypothetical protein ISN45_Aa08g006770 [Arabidopsis thaliana x Arabidopsis arenosa]
MDEERTSIIKLSFDSSSTIFGAEEEISRVDFSKIIDLDTPRFKALRWILTSS